MFMPASYQQVKWRLCQWMYISLQVYSQAAIVCTSSSILCALGWWHWCWNLQLPMRENYNMWTCASACQIAFIQWSYTCILEICSRPPGGKCQGRLWYDHQCRIYISPKFHTRPKVGVSGVSTADSRKASIMPGNVLSTKWTASIPAPWPITLIHQLRISSNREPSNTPVNFQLPLENFQTSTKQRSSMGNLVRGWKVTVWTPFKIVSMAMGLFLSEETLGRLLQIGLVVISDSQWTCGQILNMILALPDVQESRH